MSKLHDTKEVPLKGSDIYNGLRGTCFNDNWKFHYGDTHDAYKPGYNDSAWEPVELPHDFSILMPFSEDSAAGDGGGYLDGGIGWYRKTFPMPGELSGKRTTIQFDGIYMNSEVWINGTYLGIRPYGYTSFEYDLTPHLNYGEQMNVIAVKVNNAQPCSRWYSGSGIYRNVWLTNTNQIHVAYCGFHVRTPVIAPGHAETRIFATVENNSDQNSYISLMVNILDPGGSSVGTHTSNNILMKAKNGKTMTLLARVYNPELWSIESPQIYRAILQVRIGTTVIDQYEISFGFRTYRFEADTGFYLNDRNIKLKGVNQHHDLGALGAAVNYRAIERQVEILKNMGCNAIRTSHNPPDPMLLEICDRLGLVVIEEAFDSWKQKKTLNDYHLYFDAWAETDIKAMVRRDRNHPCIIMWSIGNEIRDTLTSFSILTAQKLINWVKEEDDTRLLTIGSNYNEWALDVAALVDVIGYNYNTHLYDLHHQQYPNWKMYASETSSAVRSRGIYKFPSNNQLPPSDDNQCSSCDNTVVEWGASAEKSYALINNRPWMAGEFIWSGFDYIGEPTPYGWPSKNSYFGIIDTAGFPKDIYYFYKSKWTEEPMVHILPHWNWGKGQDIEVRVYSNCDSVSLFLNGKSLGEKRFASNKPILDQNMHLSWIVPFEPGSLKAVAKSKESIVAEDERKTAGTPAQIKMIPDRTLIQADSSDMVFVETHILDKEGILVPYADNMVTFSLFGGGKIAGVDNGDATCHESYKGPNRSAFCGKCLLIVKTAKTAGTITIRAESEGLLPGKIIIQSKE